MDEVTAIEGPSNHASSQTQASHWPEAPDLQLSSSEDSDSDDSSVELVHVSPSRNVRLMSRTSTSATSQTVDLSPSSCRHRKLNLQPGAMESVPGPSASSTLSLVKMAGTEHIAPTSSMPAKNSHLLIDLTSSDEDSNQPITHESAPTSHSNNNNRILPCKPQIQAQGSVPSADMNSAPSRNSCILENPSRPTTLSRHSHPTNGQMRPGSLSCRYLFAPHSQLVDHANNNQAQMMGPSAETSNIGADPCSYSNCFVGNPSSGAPSVAAAGPCPHNHGFCPVPSPQVYFSGTPSAPHIPPMALANPYGFIHGPQILGPGLYGPLMTGHNSHPPVAHGHNYACSGMDPRLNPNHQRIWLSQQNLQEQQRRHMYIQPLAFQRTPRDELRNTAAQRREREALARRRYHEARRRELAIQQTYGHIYPGQPPVAHMASAPQSLSHILCPAMEANIATWGGVSAPPQQAPILQMNNPATIPPQQIPCTNMGEPHPHNCNVEAHMSANSVDTRNDGIASPLAVAQAEGPVDVLQEQRDVHSVLSNPDVSGHRHYPHYHGGNGAAFASLAYVPLQTVPRPEMYPLSLPPEFSGMHHLGLPGHPYPYIMPRNILHHPDYLRFFQQHPRVVPAPNRGASRAVIDRYTHAHKYPKREKNRRGRQH
ncbi:hypothetical protein HDE_13598 [Halotydeus destructor]|nr:hypothetical protein HDE_13598 [Halotydeus destructor]